MADSNPLSNPKVVIKRMSKVQAARETLKQQALEIVKLYKITIKDALAAGEFDVAAKMMQWFMEHAPEDEGVRIIDPNVNAKAVGEQKGHSGPVIQIGFALGGVTNQAKQLPPAIDVDLIESEEQDEPTNN